MKETFRARMQSELRSQKPGDRARKSLRIREKLFAGDAFLKATTVCFYVSTPTEVDTEPMIDGCLEMGKKVLVPLADLNRRFLSVYEIKDRANDLKKGAFGIWEPRPEKTRRAEPDEIDCVVVPGLVFDKNHHRIGHGKGFYDRFLKTLNPNVPKIGLAFSFQIVPEIPFDEQDVKLDEVLTED